MTNTETQADWALAADAEIAAQIGRLTLDNATLRAQGRAQSAALDKCSADLVQTLSALSQLKEELAKANAELALLKDVKPAAPAAPGGLPAHDAAG